MGWNLLFLKEFPIKVLKYARLNSKFFHSSGPWFSNKYGTSSNSFWLFFFLLASSGGPIFPSGTGFLGKNSERYAGWSGRYFFLFASSGGPFSPNENGFLIIKSAPLLGHCIHDLGKYILKYRANIHCCWPFILVIWDISCLRIAKLMLDIF